MKSDYETETIEPEVIEFDHTTEHFGGKSAVEHRYNIRSYDSLVQNLGNMEAFDELEELLESEKVYSKVVGRENWKNAIYLAKPPLVSNINENKTLVKAYGFLIAMATAGEYPLPSLYANYIGVGLDELFKILSDTSLPNREIHAWVYNILETVNQMNMLRKNGDFSARKWQEESSEYKVKAVDRLQQATENNRIAEIKKLGESIDLKEQMRKVGK